MRRSPATVAFAAAVATSLVVLFAPRAPGVAPFPNADKVVHLVLFAALAASTRWRFGGSAVGLLLVAAYAPVSELVQASLLPDRSGDWLDASADLLGAAAGWLLAAGGLRRAARD